MQRVAGWLGLGGVLLTGLVFALNNTGRRVTIDLGVVTLYQVPVTFVAFGGMVAGMGVVLLAGINADLRVRKLLRERGGARSLREKAGPDSERSNLPGPDDDTGPVPGQQTLGGPFDRPDDPRNPHGEKPLE